MRLFASVLAVTLIACGSVASTPDADPPDPCAACDVNATCSGSGPTATCACDPGFSGDGNTCVDVNECDTANGGCDVNATCGNTPGSRTCTCLPAFEGDGVTCTPWVDEARRGCAFLQAEHPGYTTIARDVALCGGGYDTTNIATACHTGWHVCRVPEWTARYPLRTYRASPSDPDLIGPTIGYLTSWGVDQNTRCGGNIWESTQPTNANTWGGSVCFYPDDAGFNTDGADYNPYNSGKYLFAADGVTILQGYNAQGVVNCCEWDASFGPRMYDTSFAVYCCLD